MLELYQKSGTMAIVSNIILLFFHLRHKHHELTREGERKESALSPFFAHEAVKGLRPRKDAPVSVGKGQNP